MAPLRSSGFGNGKEKEVKIVGELRHAGVSGTELKNWWQIAGKATAK